MAVPEKSLENLVEFKKGDDYTKEMASKAGKHPSYHLRAYRTADDLKEAVDEYIEKTDKKDMTMTGLLLHLGVTWTAMNKWRKGEIGDEKEGRKYKQVIEWARLHVENAYEMGLRSGKPVGNIFALKNINSEEWDENKEKQSSITLNLGVVLLPKRNFLEGGNNTVKGKIIEKDE